MIAVAVVASLVVYAWIMGYLGNTTSKSGKSIQIQSQSFTQQGNLVLYVQNIGQGAVHLKQDGSVYVNDVLKNILSYDGNQAASGQLIAVNPSQTVSLVIDVAYHAGDKIKVVTTEGTFMETSGSGNSGSSGGGSSNQPIASFSFTPTSPAIGEYVSFSDTSSGGSGINQWSWNFGDSETSTLANPTHAYMTAGSKTVSLTVTDSNGKTSTTTQTIVVSDFNPPSASFTFSPTAPAVAQSVAFTDTSTRGSGTITAWSWTFGSGATPTSSTAQNPSASFGSAGQKTVSLTITDSNGKTSTTTQNVNVAFDAPTAQFTLSTSNPNVGQSVTFTDTSLPASTGTINQWSWSFGDGGTGATQSPTHSYTTPGQKTVTLTVTDTNGKTSTATHTLTVDDYLPPVASFAYSPTAPVVSQTVAFTDTSTRGSGTINAWSWNFGSGTTPSTSSAQNPSASFASEGQKTVSLTVTDSNGKSSTATQTIQVNTASTPTPTPSTSPNPSPSPTPTGGPIPTPTASPTPNPNEHDFSFEGNSQTWDDGWDDWANPPWYRDGTVAHTGASSAKTDANGNNDGPFTSDPINAQGATVIHVSFWYRAYLTENGDLTLWYSGVRNPDAGPSPQNHDFKAVPNSNIGADTNGAWVYYSCTITDSSAFTSYFRFRFQSLLSGELGGQVEQIWVDDVNITIDK